MEKFKQKLFLFIAIGLIPISIIVIGYFIYDPFKVLKSYDTYSNSPVILNRDYISTETFLKYYQSKHYNSFVFGSSRTIAFKPLKWKYHLNRKVKPFMFDASGENLFGIYSKLKFLDSLNINIDNALLIFCRDVTFFGPSNPQDHLRIKHPITSGESFLKYHFTFFKAYMSTKFLISFYAYKLFGAYKPFMKGFIENRKINYDTITNELRIIDQEIEISANPSSYYKKREAIFYNRIGEKIDTIPRINASMELMLRDIKSILEKHKTSYKVVLSPLYEQTKFNEEDYNILRKIFGKKLYDFTGKNSFTDSKFNYFEASHYRPHIGDSIMARIYP